MRNRTFSILLFLIVALHTQAQITQFNNKPEKINGYQDLGFGMFIHCNIDVSLSTGINHSLVVASDEYVEKYFTELPAFFNPEKYINAYITRVSYEDWKHGDRKSFVLEPIEGNSKTKIND